MILSIPKAHVPAVVPTCMEKTYLHPEIWKTQTHIENDVPSERYMSNLGICLSIRMETIILLLMVKKSQTTSCVFQNLVNNGDFNYQPQLVDAGFLNHQQYQTPTPRFHHKVFLWLPESIWPGNVLAHHKLEVTKIKAFLVNNTTDS